MRVSIIIVNWNGLEYLAECLDSLQEQSFRDFEVVLVDNGSKDASVPFLREHYPWVKLVELEENTGFATGNNVGLSHAVGEYVVTLNNDTRAERRWLEKLVAVADAHPEVGMVGCRTCVFDDPDLIDTLGARVCPDGMSRGDYRLQRFSGLGLGQVVEGLYPSACAALYKRQMIDEVGFFDDDFFAYAEDTDLGLRGRLAGWRTLLVTDAIVHHKYSGTGGAFSPFKVYQVERNHYWVAFKNFPLRMLLLLPVFTLLRYLEQGRAVLAAKGSGREFLESASGGAIAGAILRGTRDGLAGLPAMWRKRAQLRRGNRLSPGEMTGLLRQYRLSFRELLDQE